MTKKIEFKVDWGKIEICSCFNSFCCLLWLSNVHCHLCKGSNLLISLGVFGTPFYGEGTKGKTQYRVFVVW